MKYRLRLKYPNPNSSPNPNSEEHTDWCMCITAQNQYFGGTNISLQTYFKRP